TTAFRWLRRTGRIGMGIGAAGAVLGFAIGGMLRLPVLFNGGIAMLGVLFTGAILIAPAQQLQFHADQLQLAMPRFEASYAPVTGKPTSGGPPKITSGVTNA